MNDGRCGCDAAELPESTASLARRNGLPVSHARFDADASRLVEAVRRVTAAR